MTGESKSSTTPIINAHSSTLDQGKVEHLVSGILNCSPSSTVVLSSMVASTFCITTHFLSRTLLKAEFPLLLFPQKTKWAEDSLRSLESIATIAIVYHAQSNEAFRGKTCQNAKHSNVDLYLIVPWRLPNEEFSGNKRR